MSMFQMKKQALSKSMTYMAGKFKISLVPKSKLFLHTVHTYTDIDQ